MSLAIASRYANALADSVLGTKGAIPPESVADYLRAIASAIEGSPDFRNVLVSPAVSLTKKQAVMGKLCEKIGMPTLIRNFVFIVIRNRRGNLFPQILESYEQALDQRTGIVKAEVSSANELSEASRARLEGQLARLTGKKVRCQYSVDPSLVGGAVARIGSRLYDGSVRGQLETLRRKLSKSA